MVSMSQQDGQFQHLWTYVFQIGLAGIVVVHLVNVTVAEQVAKGKMLQDAPATLIVTKCLLEISHTIQQRMTLPIFSLVSALFHW